MIDSCDGVDAAEVAELRDVQAAAVRGPAAGTTAVEQPRGGARCDVDAMDHPRLSQVPRRMKSDRLAVGRPARIADDELVRPSASGRGFVPSAVGKPDFARGPVRSLTNAKHRSRPVKCAGGSSTPEDGARDLAPGLSRSCDMGSSGSANSSSLVASRDDGCAAHPVSRATIDIVDRRESRAERVDDVGASRRPATRIPDRRC